MLNEVKCVVPFTTQKIEYTVAYRQNKYPNWIYQTSRSLRKSENLGSHQRKRNSYKDAYRAKNLWYNY